MKKTRILILVMILLVLTGVFLVRLLSENVTGAAISNSRYSYTKAICEGNSCVDYEVVCNGDELVDMKPVTGAVIFPSDWEDPRDEEMKNKLCG